MGGWKVVVAVFLGICAAGAARGQTPEGRADVWTGVMPGMRGPFLDVVKDLPPPKEGGPRTKPIAVPQSLGMDLDRYNALLKEAERRARELRAKTPPEELPKPPVHQQPNGPPAAQAPSKEAPKGSADVWTGVLTSGKKPQQSAAATNAVEKITAPELRYRLFSRFWNVWFCDPDSYPVGRPLIEKEGALKAFPEIQNDSQTFQAIAEHLGLNATKEFTDAQKLLIYREYKRLRGALRLEPMDANYKFELAFRDKSGPAASFRDNLGGAGFTVQGVIDPHDGITILKKEPVILGCPICLARGTHIDTPSGPTAVEGLKPGMLVWTLDAKNQRVALPILKTSAVPVAIGHSMIHLVMGDGREVWASAGHPTADGHSVDQLRRETSYDGATIAETEIVPYKGGKTYDLLPGGDTGFYWANGILLGSTLHQAKR